MALSIVYAPQDAATSPAIDIVAVHGLGGDSTKTWTHPKSKAFWLKDFLPVQIPDARIMTFGYNADAAFGQSTAEVIDHAKSLLASLVDKREEAEEINRPLIFIAHSLGGIVVKQALFQARLESRYQSIQDATLGLIFLGTPHRGSDKATYGKVLANVAQFVTHRPPARLLTALQTNSDVLLRLTTDFRFQLPDYQVCSFYEQRPMKGLSSLIVEKHSALLEVNHEEQIPVDADHSVMCKFETDSDDTFEKVYKRVRRMKTSPRRVASEQSASYNKHFEVPCLLSPVFTGHDEIRKSVDVSLDQARLHHSVQRRFVLFGLGGSGKTQICLHYAQKHRERYWGIFWVDASTSNSIQQSFTHMAQVLQVDENVDSVKRKLTNTSQAWLLVFDNADDPALSLTPYLPAGDRGNIIITSRNPASQDYNTVGSQAVGRLSIDDSVSLLTKMVSGTISPPEQAEEECQKVVAALGCLALAIVQAGAYLRETSCTVQDYLDIYERRRSSLLQDLPKHLGTDYRYSVYTTWQVSVDMIESRQDTISHQTLRLLKLLGFYHYDQIPLQMFYHAWRQTQIPQNAPDYLPWHETVMDFSDYRQSVQASVSLLASFSLVVRTSDASLSLHPLVHEWCRDRICKDEQDLSYRQALSLLTGAVEWRFETEDYIFRRSLVSHVHELLRLQTHQGELGGEEQMQAWPILDLILGENGWTGGTVQLSEQVLQLYKNKLGDDHPDTLSSMNNLAIRYSKAGRRTEALELSEQVLQLRKSKLGDDHPDTISSMSNLAIYYSEAGRRIEALALSEQVLELYKSKLGDDHPDTLSSMSNLAGRYSEAGRQTEALALSEQAVQLYKSKLGEDHPDTLSSISNLAIIYGEAGRQTEALALSEQAVQLRKSKLGEDHPDALSSMNNLAARYSEAGRRTEALELLEQVLQLYKSKLGDDHPDTLMSMSNLALGYGEAGRRTEALTLSEQVLQLYKSKLGEDHLDTLRSMSNLIIGYSEVGRLTEALELSEQVLPLYKSRLGDDHPETLMLMSNLAIYYSEAGRRIEALALSEQVLELYKSKLGYDHPGTLLSMSNLAGRYSEAGRRTEALELLEQVLQLRKSKLGDDHPDTLSSMSNLVMYYNEAGRRTEALELLKQVLQLHKSKLGYDHPDTLSSMSNLAVLYGEAGRRTEALELSEQVLQLRKSKLGDDHPDTFSSMNNLVIYYNEAGRRTEALALSEQMLQLRKSKLGEDHLDTLRSMSNLAIRYSEAGRQTEALALSEQAVQLYKSKLGDDHSDTLLSMSNLAIRYSKAGRQTEALTLSEQVLQLRKSKLGDDHPDTLLSISNLAIIYGEAGRRTEALALSEQAVQLRKSKLGDDHLDTLSSMSNLAVHYNEAGRQTEALALSEQVLQLCKSKLGDDHPNTLSSINNLAIIYSEAGRRTEALALSEQAVQLRKSKLGEDHPDTLMSMHSLALRYGEIGRWTDALTLSKQAVQLYKSKLGDDHPDTLRSMQLLALLTQAVQELSSSTARHQFRHRLSKLWHKFRS